MESTGSYWIPIYELLEEQGFEVHLINAYHLKAIPDATASNKKGGSANGVILYYNYRATSENIIKEVKGGFGMEKMPSGYFPANALYFAIGVLTYNCFIAQKFMTMPKELQNKTIESIRWLLVEVPGKIIRHAKNTILKIATTVEKFTVFLSMRGKTECMSSA